VVYDTSDNTWTTQRYYPYGSTRSGEVPTDRLFTGQRFDGTIGLYDYGARFYDPALGRFISADPIVPNLANPQNLNWYSYVYNRPLVYVDDSGHIAIIPIINSIVVVASKVVDYGLTAYDAWQSGRVLADPNASRGNKMIAGLNEVLSRWDEVLADQVNPQPPAG
jgi:RHS repeat-associated protein